MRHTATEPQCSCLHLHTVAFNCATHLVVHNRINKHLVVVCVAVAGGGDDAICVVVSEGSLVGDGGAGGASYLRGPVETVVVTATRNKTIGVFTINGRTR